MIVKRASLFEGASSAEGYVIVIDVFRAFTCASILFSKGIISARLCSDPDEALRLKTSDDIILLGEVKGKKYPGYDYGNSPSALIVEPDYKFKGKKAIQRTSAGTRGAVAAMSNSERVFVAGYANAKATVEVIKTLADQKKTKSIVTIVGMGMHGDTKSLEDEFCADYIEYLFTGKSYDHMSKIWEILNEPFTVKNLNSGRSHFPREDVTICLQRDIFNFALAVTEESTKDIVELKKISATY